jgi:hypothetical protein
LSKGLFLLHHLKRKLMMRFFYVLGLLLASLLLNAQDAEFTKDVEKQLKVYGSTASYDMAFDQSKQMAQTWGMGLGNIINAYLQEKGF